MNAYSREVVEQVVDLYSQGLKPTDIAELVGVGRQTVYHMLDREGVERRRRNTSKPERKSAKCPKCGAKEHLPNADFCYKCGTDIRSPVVVALEHLSAATGLIAKVWHGSGTDELCVAVNELRNALKEEGII